MGADRIVERTRRQRTYDCKAPGFCELILSLFCCEQGDMVTSGGLGGCSKERDGEISTMRRVVKWKYAGDVLPCQLPLIEEGSKMNGKMAMPTVADELVCANSNLVCCGRALKALEAFKYDGRPI